MARPQNIILTQQPAILPAIPEIIAGKAFYAGRIIQSHHTDKTGVFQDNYTSTGIFPAPNETQAKDSLIKGMSAYFDLDLVDLFDTDDDLNKALTAFTAAGVTEIHTTSNGRSVTLADVQTTAISDTRQEKARQGVRKDVIKAWLTSLPEADLIAFCESIGAVYVDQLIEHIGKPTLITYTGTGLHAHYFIDDAEGWTQNGILLAGDTTLKANLADFKAAYKVLVREIARNNDGRGFDTARCDVGLGVSRNVGTTNQKNSANIKDVKQIMVEKCDVNRTITLEDITIEPAPKTTTRKRGSARDRIKSAGSASGTGHDARVKRIKARLKADSEITYDDNGTEVTLTVDELMDQWDALKDQGIVTDDNGDKMKCRLDWVSQGSINAWCRKDAESGAITFICDVEKYLDPADRHVFDESGKLVGKWVYEGSLRSQLIVTPKGALVRNLHNYSILLQLDPRTARQLRWNNRTAGIEVSAEIHRNHRPGNAKFEAEARVNDWFPITDSHGIYIKMALESFYTMSISKDDLYAAIEFVAGMNGHDEVQAWLNNVQWDGKQRLDGDDAWLCRFMGVTKAETELFQYYEFVGRAMMLAIVRNIYAVDGHPVSTQHMALMRGGQNFGKSLMASVLAAVPQLGPRYFAEMNSDLLNRGSGDIIQALAGKTVIEIPELSAFSKKDAETVKNFITQRIVEGRKAYGRNVTRYEKSVYMIGNTNKYKPLTDSTGARRFLMIDFYNDYRNGKEGTYQWDRDALIALVPQLYAEAKARAVEGIGIPAERLEHQVRYCGTMVDNWNLTPVEIAVVNGKNKAYTNLNAVTESVYDILDKLVAQGQTRTTLSAIRKELKEEYQITVQSNIQINEALSEKNWQHKRPGGIRCVEFQGELTNEQEARSVTHANATINAPRDVAKNSNEGSQMAAMMTQIAELKKMMEESAAREAKKDARIAELEAMAMRPEPRRQRPTRKKVEKKAAPKTDAPLTIDSALEILSAAGQDKFVSTYKTITDDEPSRKKMFAETLIRKAEMIRA